jgi:hypothetical protein
MLGARPLVCAAVLLAACSQDRPAPRVVASTVRFENRRAREVSLDWLDFGGQRKNYASIGPGATVVQSTCVGHVWIVSERGTTLGAVVAAEGDNRAVIP